MKFIRNWIKNIVKEAVIESIPPLNISISERKDQDSKLTLEGGIFIDSVITLSKKESDKGVKMSNCVIKQKDKDKPCFMLIKEEK